MSIGPPIPEIQHFQNLTLKIQGQGQMTMTLHNYRSRQVHETSNGINPSSGFRDKRSAKSGPNLCQIWQVFGPWASPYGANGQMTITVHNYRPRQFHRTSNGENPSSSYRDMGSASLAAARPPGPWQYPSSPEGWGVKMTSSCETNENFIKTISIKMATSSTGSLKIWLRLGQFYFRVNLFLDRQGITVSVPWIRWYIYVCVCVCVHFR